MITPIRKVDHCSRHCRSESDTDFPCGKTRQLIGLEDLGPKEPAKTSREEQKTTATATRRNVGTVGCRL